MNAWPLDLLRFCTRAWGCCLLPRSLFLLPGEFTWVTMAITLAVLTYNFASFWVETWAVYKVLKPVFLQDKAGLFL